MISEVEESEAGGAKRGGKSPGRSGRRSWADNKVTNESKHGFERTKNKTQKLQKFSLISKKEEEETDAFSGQALKLKKKKEQGKRKGDVPRMSSESRVGKQQSILK